MIVTTKILKKKTIYVFQKPKSIMMKLAFILLTFGIYVFVEAEESKYCFSYVFMIF